MIYFRNRAKTGESFLVDFNKTKVRIKIDLFTVYRGINKAG